VAHPSDQSDSESRGSRLLGAAPVIVVGSVMFVFISYWRVAAVVLCDMASTAFYIGGIVEQLVGPAAPWFILAVMLFSYGQRPDLHGHFSDDFNCFGTVYEQVARRSHSRTCRAGIAEAGGCPSDH